MGTVQRFLIVLGAVFLAAIVLGVVVIGVFAVKGSALDKESKAYVDNAVPIIVSDWDEKELLSRASQEFMQVTDKEDLDKLFGFFRKLGRMREYQGSEGQSNISFTTEDGRRITAAYTAKASFEAGPAVIKITLIKHGEQWQIAGFRVNSDVFLKR
jgi:hypothetical protein